MSTKISEHFTYEEFYADSETARKNSIDNTPDAASQKNIYELVEKILEPVRKKYGRAIKVTCGYRCPKLNKLVGGSSTSQHMNGGAADICCTSTGTNRLLFDTILDMIDKNEITVGQLIWEYGSSTNPAWVHVSIPYTKKNQILRAVKVNGKSVYKSYR